jgi:signal transduction histidine kinase
VWFICAEALANVARHAGARTARVTLDAGPDRALLTVADDGRGAAAPARGLRGIADRAEALGGTFALDSPPGGPTRLRVELPYA